ncbi:MAG: hypothetical protein ACOX44_00085 [Limnochordia bacterium]
MNQDPALLCVQRLAQLAEEKYRVLQQRQPTQLQPIVEAEEAVLAQLRQLQQAEAASADRSAADAAALAAAVTELQRLSSLNAALLQESLAGVTRCLELLAADAAPTYSAEGKGRTTTGAQRLLDVTG